MMSCIRNMRPQLARHALANHTSTLFRQSIRPLSTAPKQDEPTTASLSPRWLSDLKTRIGRCITFGLSPTQTTEACSILQEIANDWRGLVAGPEGFLTDKANRGLYRQEVVWGEMHGYGNIVPRSLIKDIYRSTGHVNNVVYNRWAESGRVNWVLNYAHRSDPARKQECFELLTPLSIGLILRSIRTDYKFPMKYPDRVTVLHRLRSKPEADTDHFILDVLILSELHRRPAARCVEDIVVYDYQQAKKAPLKPFMVDLFKQAWEQQEEAKKTYGNKVNALIGRVRELEQTSWDRADATEDFGSAANKT